MAYAQLVSEGYIESYPKKGYYVSNIEDVFELPIEVEKKEKIEASQKYKVDFSPSGVDMSNFPYNKWRKIMKDCMINDNSEIFQSGNHQGDEGFRQIIKTYLHQSRGVSCNSEQIVIRCFTVLGMIYVQLM